ncbi:hypothetical protein [Bradyrhizobium sp.]|uniref:hypothetical protein n=1 Tax=Bradyrhizobium sp. TaxID=376 RepID=UPI003C3DF9F3
MKLRGWIVGLLMVAAAAPLAMAQSGPSRSDSSEQYVPRLGDIMNNAQIRHIKLWYAAKAANWELAAFEIRQLQENLVEAALLYSGIPVTNVTTLAAPLQAVADAIDAKDSKKFAKAFGDLTGGCNSCHQSMQRAFVLIRTPTEQPFGDQVFPPQGKK